MSETTYIHANEICRQYRDFAYCYNKQNNNQKYQQYMKTIISKNDYSQKQAKEICDFIKNLFVNVYPNRMIVYDQKVEAIPVIRYKDNQIMYLLNDFCYPLYQMFVLDLEKEYNILVPKAPRWRQFIQQNFETFSFNSDYYCLTPQEWATVVASLVKEQQQINTNIQRSTQRIRH